MAQAFSDRLRMLLAYRKRSQRDLADEIRAEPNTVNGWVNGRAQPIGPVKYAIAKALNIDYAWLDTGEGAAPWDRQVAPPETSLADVVQEAVVRALEEAQVKGIPKKDLTAPELKERDRRTPAKSRKVQDTKARPPQQGKRRYGTR